jgi:hypothetical protein
MAAVLNEFPVTPVQVPVQEQISSLQITVNEGNAAPGISPLSTA